MYISKFVLPTFIAAAAVAFFVFSYHYIGGDEGSYTYEAMLVLLGKVPFKDFVTRAPAGLLLLSAYAFFFGTSMLALKVFNFICIVAILCVTYFIVRKFQSVPVSLLAVLIVLINPLFFLTKLVFNTTVLSGLSMVGAAYCLHKDTHPHYVIAGILLGCAVFIRELYALPALLITGYIFLKIGRKKAYLTAAGGGSVALIGLVYFSAILGFDSAVTVLFGLGHLVVSEPYSSPLSVLGKTLFATVSLFSLVVGYILIQRDYVRSRMLYPETIWISSLIVFYAYYIFKRGLLLSYASEFIVPSVIFIFCISSMVGTTRAKKQFKAAVLCMCLPLFLYALIDFTPRGYSSPHPHQYNLNYLIGTGLPLSSYRKTGLHLIKQTSPNDVIFAGNLAFPAEYKRRQFLDMSRPLIYERRSGVYSLYNAPSKEQVVDLFKATPPTIVIADPHLSVAFWPELDMQIESQYSLIYNDKYIAMYRLNEASSTPSLEQP